MRRMFRFAPLMVSVGWCFLLAAVPFSAAPVVAVAAPQTSEASTPGETTAGVTHVLGLGDIKRGANGQLTVHAGAMRFQATGASAEVKVADIRDVFTAQDSKRLVGGTLGTVTRVAAPYGSGRVISLFRQGIDVLTVEYVDANGGLHGVIFTLPRGRAEPVKKALVAQGAHASIPVEEASGQPKPKEGKPK